MAIYQYLLANPNPTNPSAGSQLRHILRPAQRLQAANSPMRAAF